jgi:hypothetical protein
MRAVLFDWFPTRPVVRIAGLCVATLPLLFFYYRNGWIEGPRNYPQKLSWGWGMKMESGGVRYFDSRDKDAVIAQIEKSFASNEHVRVDFYPGGDALFFCDAFGKRAIPYSNHFSTVEPDAILIHQSRYDPGWLVNRKAMDLRLLKPETISFHQRDGTEQWFLADLRTNPVPRN